jgi:hypothetical protein
VELEVHEVTLVVSPREDTAWYLFDCFNCARRVVKPAPRTVAVALTAVRTPVWTVPAEVLERVEPHELPPIAVDDVLDALLVLGRGADLVALAAGPAPPAGGLMNPNPGEAGSRRSHPKAA